MDNSSPQLTGVKPTGSSSPQNAEVKPTGNSLPLLQLKNIDVTFFKGKGLFRPKQEIKVLSGVNLEIYPGEVLALVGESGGGKTTVGNVITCLVKPSAGEKIFNGENVLAMTNEKLNEYRKNVQLVQQDSYAALNPSRTVRQSLTDPIIIRKVAPNRKAAEIRVKELLETVELKPIDMYIDKYPHQLSGGQRQRVLMARAISLNPKLIIADEPVSMIDVSLRISVLNLMSRLNAELGIAFLYITHDLATARYISRNGRICVLYLGKVVEIGPVLNVIDQPAHPYLQALLSAVPVPDPVIAAKRKRFPLKSFDMPSILTPPPGCRFHTRCPYAQPQCETDECPLTEFNGRLTACIRAGEIPDYSKYEEEII